MTKWVGVKLFYDNGEITETEVNGQCSTEEIKDYFEGKYFDLGIFPTEDMHQCIKIEIEGAC